MILAIQKLKITLPVDTRSSPIIDSHVTTTRKYDSQIAPSIIKHRKYSSLHIAWNAQLDADIYVNGVETVSFRIKRKYGAFVRS
ncbi:ISH9-type transposase [Haloferax denitrificans ATCC 35960]|uniref:ISH9-type transposase n=2 Tax=Haloferax TaxID=2251 RepID=M0JFW8_9EURY|nr:ISH9-type transposase [Haloferax denitrificans ATCC 35960]